MQSAPDQNIFKKLNSFNTWTSLQSRWSHTEMFSYTVRIIHIFTNILSYIMMISTRPKILEKQKIFVHQ